MLEREFGCAREARGTWDTEKGTRARAPSRVSPFPLLVVPATQGTEHAIVKDGRRERQIGSRKNAVVKILIFHFRVEIPCAQPYQMF